MTHSTILRSSPKSFQEQGAQAWNPKVGGIFKSPTYFPGPGYPLSCFGCVSQSFSISPHINSSSTDHKGPHSIFVKKKKFLYIIQNLFIKISWWNDTLHCCKHLLGLACPFGLCHSSQGLFPTSSQALYPESSLLEMPDYSSHEDFFLSFLIRIFVTYVHSFICPVFIEGCQ